MTSDHNSPVLTSDQPMLEIDQLQHVQHCTLCILWLQCVHKNYQLFNVIRLPTEITSLTSAAGGSAACHCVLERSLHQEPSASCSAHSVPQTFLLPVHEADQCIAYSSVLPHDQSWPTALSTAPYICILAHHCVNHCKHSTNYISCL